MRFSVIVPVYNVDKYLKKCLDSVINQTYNDFEVIIVNDGSTDNCQIIIEEYLNKYPKFVKSFSKENEGLSEARNLGYAKSKGEYIFFLDSDDYIDPDLFEIVNSKIENDEEIEIIRIPKYIVGEEGKIIKKDCIKEFTGITGQDAFLKIRNNKIILETAWTYFFKRKFWKVNKFKFAKGKIHEDFGIIPLVILKAKRVSAISSPFYYYVKRNNSIVNNKTYSNELKKAWDVIFHYDFLLNEIYKINNLKSNVKDEYIYYITATLFLKLKNLNKYDMVKFKDELIKRKVLDKLSNRTLKYLIKKNYYFFVLNNKFIY